MTPSSNVIFHHLMVIGDTKIDRARLEPCPVVAIHPYGQVAETIFNDSTLK